MFEKDLENTKNAIQEQIQMVSDEIPSQFENLPYDSNSSDTNAAPEPESSISQEADDTNVIAPESKP